MGVEKSSRTADVVGFVASDRAPIFVNLDLAAERTDNSGSIVDSGRDRRIFNDLRTNAEERLEVRE